MHETIGPRTRKDTTERQQVGKARYLFVLSLQRLCTLQSYPDGGRCDGALPPLERRGGCPARLGILRITLTCMLPVCCEVRSQLVITEAVVLVTGRSWVMVMAVVQAGCVGAAVELGKAVEGEHEGVQVAADHDGEGRERRG